MKSNQKAKEMMFVSINSKIKRLKRMEEILRLEIEGFNFKDIGEKFGVHGNSIGTFAVKNKISYLKLDQDELFNKLISVKRELEEFISLKEKIEELL